MIEASQLYKSFAGVPAVRGVSFRVPEGGRLMLLGTSGSGKTTTLRMLNRLIDPDGGQVLFRGKDTRSLRPEILRRQMGYVMQQYGLFPHYTVAENIAIVPKLLHWDKLRIRRRSEDLLQKLGLSWESHAHQYPAQLSGGQQQRVGLARALAADPPVLLMDEPFGALDPVTRARIRQEFTGLDEFKGKTVVMVTHDIRDAFEMGDHIGIMDKGKLIQTGTPEELQQNPANDFVAAFLHGKGDAP
ncbi:ATP-binding cassette domain-containing protein [Chitinophaga pollutisoli]|uniref:ATP-binding cassette domain-containing protein n=1 Tax=Chitinophaga pollutisoli TaxID=3133966 RepID=A0ABZ2YMD9_9BACT